MKTITLTVDYELFLGSKTGDVRSCMIDPTRELANILAHNGSHMTIFWDILHYVKLIEYEIKFPELIDDRLLIENQILELVNAGHDIQLHLHPHWLDAIYANGKWTFDYKRFKLQDLSENEDQNDINTILGCINKGKNILENLIKKGSPEYRVTAIRAGGYLIQPFSKIKNALLQQNILIDSSICPGMVNENEIFSYNFQDCPNLYFYKFSDDPTKIDKNGKFTEIPITSINIPFHLNFYFILLRNIKYKNLWKSKGSASGSTTMSVTPYYKKMYESLFKKKAYQFTTDGNFKEIINYMIENVDEYSTMITHPKMLTEHTINLFTTLINADKVQCISLKDYLERTVN